ncbi:MAG: inositol monophosphatase [Proteobacteria bacterium]|nr:inositol monophosphatase [Pseudomonadota bacterium]
MKFMRQPEINIAEKAAFTAGGILLRLQKQVHSLHVVKKRQNDFASIADSAAEQAIIDTIAKAHPEHAILGEEGGLIGNQEADHIWIVDPLDGTTNFLHGIPHYCVSIALEVKGIMQHALIHDPVRDETFYASRGYGAYLNDTRLRVDQKVQLTGALIATGFPFRNRQVFNRYMLQFKSIFKAAGDVRRTGSAALDLAYVAAGRVDGFWEMGLERWDMAAGALIVQEAGGNCVDFNLTKDYLDNGNIIAGNLSIIAAIQNKIKPSMSAN